MVRIALVAGAALIVAACADNTPARIELATPNVTLSDVTPFDAGARLVNRAGKPLGKPGLTYSASPATVATVGPDGAVTCHTSGSASVVVAGGGQSATFSVICRIAESIDAPRHVRLTLGRVPEVQAIVARDGDGNELPGAPIRATVSDPGVIGYANRTLTPLSVGTAEVGLASGKASARISVAVVELIKSEPLAMADGASITFSLQQGAYELDLKAAPSNGGKSGLAVDWLGADCAPAAEAQQHNLKCSVRETASLTIKNPTTFGFGPTLNGFVNLYRTAP